MKRLFADSFFFFAYLNGNDASHQAAEDFFEGFDGALVTTEWVLTEVADGMAGNRDRQTFSAFHEALRSDSAVRVIPASPELFAEGMVLYSTREDKEWSLTDCISFVVMKREGLEEALTGDHHFRQAGFKALL